VVQAVLLRVDSTISFKLFCNRKLRVSHLRVSQLRVQVLTQELVEPPYWNGPQDRIILWGCIKNNVLWGIILYLLCGGREEHSMRMNVCSDEMKSDVHHKRWNVFLSRTAPWHDGWGCSFIERAIPIPSQKTGKSHKHRVIISPNNNKHNKARAKEWSTEQARNPKKQETWHQGECSELQCNTKQDLADNKWENTRLMGWAKQEKKKLI